MTMVTLRIVDQEGTYKCLGCRANTVQADARFCPFCGQTVSRVVHDQAEKRKRRRREQAEMGFWSRLRRHDEATNFWVLGSNAGEPHKVMFRVVDANGASGGLLGRIRAVCDRIQRNSLRDPDHCEPIASYRIVHMSQEAAAEHMEAHGRFNWGYRRDVFERV